APVRLALAGEGRLQVFVGTGSLEARHGSLLSWFLGSPGRRACPPDHSRGPRQRQLPLCIPVIACAYGTCLRGGQAARAGIGAAAATALVGQLEDRREPPAGSVAQLQPAAVAARQSIDDRETETGSLGAAPGRVEPVERPQQLGERFLRHAGPLVL